MKNEILQWVKTDRSFESAKQLFMKYGSGGLKYTLNRQAENPVLRGILYEELRKMAGIEAKLWEGMFKIPTVKEVPQTLKDRINANDSSPEVITADQVKEFIRQIPEGVKKSIRLRDEFPFLAEKECPDELKILVHDMLSAYDAYVTEHAKLFEVVTNEEMQEVAASVVENYIENHEIWDELNHYKTAGEILGKHQIFTQKDRVAEIKAMSNPELIKLRENLESRKSRNASKVKNEPEHKNIEERKAAVATCEFELSIVNSILGISPAK